MPVQDPVSKVSGWLLVAALAGESLRPPPGTPAPAVPAPEVGFLESVQTGYSEYEQAIHAAALGGSTLAVALWNVLLLLRSRRRERERAQRELEVLHETQRAGILSHQQLDYLERESADLQAARLICRYAVPLVPRLDDFCRIQWLSADASLNLGRDRSRVEADRTSFRRFAQNLHRPLEPDPIDPSDSWFVWVAFTAFQVVAAFRLALDERWRRRPTGAQEQRLAVWENSIEPVLTGTRYPAAPFFYRDELEVIAHEMLVRTEQDGVRRPRDWKEFVELWHAGAHVRAYSSELAARLLSIFDESVPLAVRRRLQCRLAFLGLYLIHYCDMLDQQGMSARAKRFRDRIADVFRDECAEAQRKGEPEPEWYCFESGDVRSWAFGSTQAEPPGGGKR